MKRLLIVPAVAVVCSIEVYRRGFVAPLLFGVRLWAAAIDPRPELATSEPDYMA